MKNISCAPAFLLKVNLDCPEDLAKFLDNYEPARGRQLANRLGFKGLHSTKAANALMNYACNKRAANMCRRRGKIANAIQYEDICDRIYREDIQPLIKCW